MRLVALKHHIQTLDEPVPAALQVQEVVFPQDVRTSEAEIISIKAALARMDHGQYGICTGCGCVIPEDRLDALPFTPICDDCAGKGD